MIRQRDDGFLATVFYHRAFPLKVSTSIFSVHTEKKDGSSPLTWIVSADDFGLTLSRFDYLIVWNDDEFWELYGDSVRRSALKAVWKLDNDRLVRFDPERLSET